MICLSRCIISIVLLLTLAGCQALQQQPYSRPSLSEKESWSIQSGKNPDAEIQLDWWQHFNDPTLDLLITTAISRNFDIKIAVARVKKAEISLRRSHSRRLPGASLDVTSLRNRTSQSDYLGEYSAFGLLNWEIDLWGKLKKSIDAGVAVHASTAADWRAIWLKVTATVARTYFNLRRIDEQILFTRSSIQSGETSLDVFLTRMKAGFSTRTEVDSQEAELNSLQRQLLELQRQRDLSENRLAVLLGKPAGKVRIEEGLLQNIIRPVDVPLGLPSELISRRPDVVSAEYRVLNAHHMLGQANLARLPSFSLTAVGGNTSSVLSQLLDKWTLGLASAINIPIFNPNIQVNIDISRVRSESEQDNYRKTVMIAYEEVENALSNLENRKKQHTLLQSQQLKLETVAVDRRGQLAAGLISQLVLFEAERKLLETSKLLVNNYAAILSDTVRLYEALGGGWSAHLVAVK